MNFFNNSIGEENFYPEVSIVIPIYNAETVLEKCFTSIQKQTFNNYEVIFVDDGSSDSSLVLAKNYTCEDYRVTVISQENMGVSVARNKGIELSRGKWIMFVDPDDFLEPTILETLIKNSDDTDDIVACCCKVVLPDKEEKDSFFCGDHVFVTPEEKKELYLQLLKPSYGQPNKSYTAIGVPWGKLYRRSFLDEKNLRFDPQLKRLQDNIFNMYAFYDARKINYIDDALYNYRYEHLDTLYNSYSSGLSEALCTYMQERFIQLKNLGFLNDTDICAFYKNECIRRLIIILRNEGLNPDNHVNTSTKIEGIKRIFDIECFQYVFSNGHIGDFKGLKYKSVFFLLKMNDYRLCYLLIMGEHYVKNFTY